MVSMKKITNLESRNVVNIRRLLVNIITEVDKLNSIPSAPGYLLEHGKIKATNIVDWIGNVLNIVSCVLKRSLKQNLDKKLDEVCQQFITSVSEGKLWTKISFIAGLEGIVAGNQDETLINLLHLIVWSCLSKETCNALATNMTKDKRNVLQGLASVKDACIWLNCIVHSVVSSVRNTQKSTFSEKVVFLVKSVDRTMTFFSDFGIKPLSCKLMTIHGNNTIVLNKDATGDTTAHQDVTKNLPIQNSLVVFLGIAFEVYVNMGKTGDNKEEPDTGVQLDIQNFYDSFDRFYNEEQLVQFLSNTKKYIPLGSEEPISIIFKRICVQGQIHHVAVNISGTLTMESTLHDAMMEVKTHDDSPFFRSPTGIFLDVHRGDGQSILLTVPGAKQYKLSQLIDLKSGVNQFVVEVMPDPKIDKRRKKRKRFARADHCLQE